MSCHNDRYRLYLRDLGLQLKEYALQARQQREQSRGSESESYYLGELHAYHGVISLIQQEAKVFEIALEELRLDDIDPDHDLL